MTFIATFSVLIRAALLFGLAVPVFFPAHAQSRAVQDKQDLINWYYSATFGTGVYTAGDRTVAVIQLPFTRELRPISEEHWGLKLKVSTTFGFYDYAFENVLGGKLPNRLSTVSVLPGLEWQMPLSGRLTMRPYISGGIGQELSGKESALIYDFGVKSRFRLGRDKGVEFALVNMLTAAGYRPRGGPTQPFGVLAIGLDMEIPTDRLLFGREAYIGITPIYYYYFNELRFAEFDNVDNRLREQFEIAISLLSYKPWSLKYFEVDRLGLAIRSSNEVTGVSLFTSLPF